MSLWCFLVCEFVYLLLIQNDVLHSYSHPANVHISIQKIVAGCCLFHRERDSRTEQQKYMQNAKNKINSLCDAKETKNKKNHSQLCFFFLGCCCECFGCFVANKNSRNRVSTNRMKILRSEMVYKPFTTTPT